MKTTSILFPTLLLAALSARAATTLESGEFFVDLRESPRVSAGTESLTYSTRWAGADALAGCARKARLAVAGYAGAETLEDVPILVRLSTAIQGFDYDDFAAPATGADLVFCDEAETTVYPHEIDEWNTNGESLVWVRLPALVAGTAFKMGYGGTSATAADVAVAAHAVWSDYAGVWHMNEDSGTAFDSTANGLDATPAVGTKGNASTLSEMVAYENGVCGRARVNDAVDRTTSALTGSGNHLEVTSSAAFSLGSHFTFSGWFHSGSMTNCPRVVSRKDEYRSDNGWEIHISNHPTRATLRGASNSPTLGGVEIPDLRSGWVQLLADFEGSVVRCYTNGALAATGAVTPATDNNLPLVFGSDSDGTETTFHGQYDEIRLRGGSLSTARIRADYDMIANSGFVTIGAVEPVNAGPVISAEIRLGGAVFDGGLTGEGTVPWTPTAPGLYEFEHVSLVDGTPVATETATFVVTGTVAEDLSILADGDLTEGVTVRLGGAADGWTLHYTTNGSTPTAESPAYTGPFALAESATVKVVAVSDAHGWTTGVAEQRFDLASPLAVTGARARQRYPWNGLVDVDFTLEGDSARRYRVTVVPDDLDGGTNLVARTVWEDRGSVTNAALDVAPGAHRFVWNAGADLPEGFVADRVAVSLRAESIHDTALYLVVDLSGGPDAANYPVSYLPDIPEGGWTDEYKTDKLVLRRIEPGAFLMGSPPDELGRMRDADPFDETQHKVTLTTTCYASIFETTQQQWLDVDGGNPSALVGATRPVDSVTYSDLRGSSIGSSWPVETGVDASSFIGKLRGRVDGLAFDLPTDAQWEYVCRAGTITALNNGKNLDADGTNLSEVGRWGNNQTDGIGGYSEHATVGSYRSNSWGVFDMHGNVWEACLDWAGNNIGQDCEDPVGPISGLTGKGRIARGGAWTSGDIGYNCRSATRVDGFLEGGNTGGFRLFLHDAPAVVEAPIVAPAGLMATTNGTGDVALSWEPVAGAYAYQIRRSKTGAFEDGTWLNTVTNTTYADWTAEAFTDYAYWIRAQFESGRVSVWSEAAESKRSIAYTVRFNANGGSGTMDDIECFFDQPCALPVNVFERSGYNFLGWATNATGSVVFADGASVINLAGSAGETVNLYATWSLATYTVKFNANGGSGTMADQTFTYGAAQALSANAYTRAGYTFAGWATNQTAAVSYTNKQSVKNLTTSSTITLFAVWNELNIHNALYMVVDLSGGSSASSYPISYLSAVPSGGWTDAYKTTKLVLRRVEPGTFTMGSPIGEIGRNDEREMQHQVTLTKPFYIGVFEYTQKQWSQVVGSNPSLKTGNARPVENVSYNDIRGTNLGKWWPATNGVDATSFMGKLRARTRMDFDLPTSAQWEYACRAGTTTALNSGKNLSSTGKDSNMATVGRYGYNYSDGKGGYSEHTKVGSYASNAWGLYDMHGNVFEWCLDWYKNYGSTAVTDPVGASTTTPSTTSGDRICRGGCWRNDASWCRSGLIGLNYPDVRDYVGFRLCLTVRDPEVPSTYDIQFDANGGNGEMANQTVGIGSTVHLSANMFARAGYNFIGWTTNPGGPVEFSDMQPIKDITSASSITLYAVWDELSGFKEPYMVIDLSSGSNAQFYPISFLHSVPEGGWTDEYKTTKLVLRRVEPGTFTMGSPIGEIGRNDEREMQHQVTLTKPFYIGVFEYTQKQWSQVVGSNPSLKTGNARPVENVSYNDLRGTNLGKWWPVTNGVDATSFLGKLRARTGMDFDLPTSAQWEYACRAGTTTALNSGKNLSSTGKDSNMATVGRYGYNYSDGKGGYSEHTKVGSYASNAWGLYDMHGNVFEWCLDWYKNYGSTAVTDPVGASTTTPSTTSGDRICRGGCWRNDASWCRSALVGFNYPDVRDYVGFRLCLTGNPCWTFNPLGFALGAPQYEWETSAEAWTVTDTVSYMDGACAQSGGGGGDEIDSWVRTTISGNAKTMTFQFQKCYFYATFSVEIDGSVVYSDSSIARPGDIVWIPVSVSIPAGTHEVKFNYHHPGTGWSGQFNGVRIDAVSFVDQ